MILRPLHGELPKPRVALLAFGGGKRKFLTPAYFPVYDSEEQAMVACLERLDRDPDFRKKYEGWSIGPFDLRKARRVPERPGGGG